MKTKQCSGGRACIYSKRVTASARAILRICALNLGALDVKVALDFQIYSSPRCANLYALRNLKKMKATMEGHTSFPALSPATQNLALSLNHFHFFLLHLSMLLLLII
jgi:hypothetical protein